MLLFKNGSDITPESNDLLPFGYSLLDMRNKQETLSKLLRSFVAPDIHSWIIGSLFMRIKKNDFYS